jgi:hypothetical protein
MSERMAKLYLTNSILSFAVAKKLYLQQQWSFLAAAAAAHYYQALRFAAAQFLTSAAAAAEFASPRHIF